MYAVEGYLQGDAARVKAVLDMLSELAKWASLRWRLDARARRRRSQHDAAVHSGTGGSYRTNGSGAPLILFFGRLAEP